MPILFETFVVPGGKGPRTYQAHLAFKDIEKLGKFVDTGSPQQSPNPGEPRIIFDLEYRAANLIEPLQLREHLFSSKDHGPELIKTKPPSVEPHPLLNKEDWPWGGGLDKDSGDCH